MPDSPVSSAPTDPALCPPGYYSVPNWHSDRLRRWLSLEEQAVLAEITRMTLGWHRPYWLFSNAGATTTTTVGLAPRIGISEAPVRKAITFLLAVRVLVRYPDQEPAANQERALGVQLDAASVDWEALEARAAAKRERCERQTAAATKARKKPGVTSNDTPGGVTSDVTLTEDDGVTSDVTLEAAPGLRPTIASEGNVQRNPEAGTQRSTNKGLKNSLRPESDPGGGGSTPCAPGARPAARRSRKLAAPADDLAEATAEERAMVSAFRELPGWKHHPGDLTVVRDWVRMRPGMDLLAYGRYVVAKQHDANVDVRDLRATITRWLPTEWASKWTPPPEEASAVRPPPDRNSLTARHQALRRQLQEQRKAQQTGLGGDDG